MPSGLVGLAYEEGEPPTIRFLEAWRSRFIPCRALASVNDPGSPSRVGAWFRASRFVVSRTLAAARSDSPPSLTGPCSIRVLPTCPGIDFAIVAFGATLADLIAS